MLINSSPPSAAYMHQWTGWALVQKMACRLFDTKPLPEPMLVYCQLDSWEKISVKLELEFYDFHSRKCIWNCCLPKRCPFCSGGDELNMCQCIDMDGLVQDCGTSNSKINGLVQDCGISISNIQEIPLSCTTLLINMILYRCNCIMLAWKFWIFFIESGCIVINSSPPGQNGHHLAEAIFRSIFCEWKFLYFD